jgi:hypothetical protein
MNAARIKAPLFWAIFLLCVWLPIELLILWGGMRVQASLDEAALSLLRLQLNSEVIDFKHLLEPTQILTCRLVESLAAAKSATSPEEWRAEMMRGFADIGAGGLDLYLTDGTRMLPATPGYSPVLLSAFLASMTARADGMGDTTSTIRHLRRIQSEIDHVGNSRYTIWKWIPLPTEPGIPNRIFDDCWFADRVTRFVNTPKNTWPAFGRVPGQPGWRYLLCLHREAIRPETIRRMALTHAHRLGWRVNLPAQVASITLPQADDTRSRPSRRFYDLGMTLTVTDVDERHGEIIATGTVSGRIRVLMVMGLAANGFLSLWIVLFSRRCFYGEGLENMSVAGKTLLGLMISAGLPWLLALMGAEGATGAFVFQEVQRRQQDMETRLRTIESRFEMHLDKVAEDHRNLLATIRYPFTGSIASQVVDVLSLRNQVSGVDIISSAGVHLIHRGPFFWAAYRVSNLPRPAREWFFREWVRRGLLLFDHELDMLALDHEHQELLPKRERLRRLYGFATEGRKRVSPKLFSEIARIICYAYNHNAQPDMDIERAETGALLNLIFKDRENLFFHEALTSIGLMRPFNLAGYQAFSFFDLIRDDRGKAQALVLIIHRLSDISEVFLMDFFRRLVRDDMRILALSLTKEKADLGSGVRNDSRRALQQVFAHSGKIVRAIMPDEKGEPCLILAMPSQKAPKYAFIATLPLRVIMAQTRAIQRGYMLGLGLVGFILIGLTFWLRRLLLVPLQELKTTIQAMSQGQYDRVPEISGVGEMALLGDVFHQAVENLEQMNFARTIQEHYLPTAALQAGDLHVFGRSEMMTQVGGDYFDYLCPAPGKLLVTVGDVSGHGMGAAIVMSMVKSAVGVLAPRNLPTNEFCRALNELICKTLAKRKMMTLLLFSFDVQTGEYSFTNAGHNFPLVISPQGESRYLKQTNLPLGAMKNRPYKTETGCLQPGETLLLYTDGVLETANTHGQIIGYDRFKEFVVAQPELPADEMIRRIITFADAFAAGQPRSDDVTVVVLRRDALLIVKS